ncbi:MAG: NAD(P)H-hydrate dehydratase [Nitrospirae bacterium]|nr:NAD(P)H-hydrate dehydratase [Nitrospirota bacterium]
MLKVATAKEMQEIDRVTIEKYGIAGAILMERAGLAVAERINELFFQESGARSQESENPPSPPFTKGGQRGIKIIVLCGGGNNGGDGLVVARVLHSQGKDVIVYLSAGQEELKGDANINYNAAVKFGVRIYPASKIFTRRLSLVTRHCIIVDALLGTGLNKEVRKPLSDIINYVNKLNYPVISIDIPSGISSDTGQMMGCAIKAQYTVTFGLPKRGHLLYPGAGDTGNLYVEDIGFPDVLLKSDKIRANLIEKADAVKLMPKRPKYSHKGTYGPVLLIAGSRGKTGAAFMSAKACLRSGAGLVTIGTPETLMDIFQRRVTEEMVLPLHDKGNGTLSYKALEKILKFINKKINVLAIGPGISVDEEISKLVCELILKSKIPMVIDADGINAIVGHRNILRKAKAPIILTPHPGEMARLLQGSNELRVTSDKLKEKNLLQSVEKDRINTAISFAKETETYLVLKGVPTIIASPKGEAFINSTGNPGMATAGTGDVLTGMISAFLAQGLSPKDASVLGVYMHGLTGDVAARKQGEHSLIASDIINAIPQAFKLITA